MLNHSRKLVRSEWLFLLIVSIIYTFWTLYFLDKFYCWYGPDESCRYGIVSFIVNNRALPTGWEEELIMPMWGVSYGLDIKLPYLISAFFVLIASTFSSSEAVLIFACKLTSILSGIGISFFSIRISKSVFGSGKIRWLFIFLMSLLPQAIFITTYFNLDVFSLFTVMVIIDAWIYAYESDWSKGSCIELGAGMGLCLVSYSYAYGYLVGSLLLYILWNITNKDRTSFKMFISKGMLMLLLVFILSGWMLIRNYIIHNGDIFVYNEMNRQAAIYGNPEFTSEFSYKSKGFSVLYMLLHTDFITLTFRSLICVLGSMAIRGSVAMYTFYSLVLLFGFIFFFRYINANTIPLHITICALLSATIPVILSIFYSWSHNYQPQGRYIITVLPTIFLVASIGFKQFLDNEKHENVKKYLVSILCVLIVVFAVEAFIRCATFTFTYPYENWVSALS